MSTPDYLQPRQRVLRFGTSLQVKYKCLRILTRSHFYRLSFLHSKAGLGAKPAGLGPQTKSPPPLVPTRLCPQTLPLP